MRKWGQRGLDIGGSRHWDTDYTGSLPTRHMDKDSRPGQRYRWYQLTILTADSSHIAVSAEVSIRDT